MREDGRPHVTPLIGLWHDGAIHFCTGLREQKFRNLEHNDRVAMTTGTNTWAQGLDVVVEGTTDAGHRQRRAAARSPTRTSPSTARCGASRSATASSTTTTGGPAAVFRIDASKVIAFAKEPHAQTTYV